MTWGGEQSSDLVKVKCYQYDINGKFLKEYSSINEAARMMNGSHNGIIKVLQKELNTAYGFR